MTTHTPGPWYIADTIDGRRHGYIRRADGKAVCRVSINIIPYKESIANTRLIAAAPELLEAVKQAQRLIEEALPKFDWGASALDANAITLLNEVPGVITAVITKAEGR